MKYIIKWIEFERPSDVEVYVLVTPLEFHDIVNVIKVYYPNYRDGNINAMRCLCLLKEKEK